MCWRNPRDKHFGGKIKIYTKILFYSQLQIYLDCEIGACSYCQNNVVSYLFSNRSKRNKNPGRDMRCGGEVFRFSTPGVIIICQKMQDVASLGTR